jgi:hypothetical protein
MAEERAGCVEYNLQVQFERINQYYIYIHVFEKS